MRSAYQEKELTVKERFAQKGIAYQNYNLFIRAFKKTQEVEIWVKGENKDTYEHLTTYSFCSTSGSLGPKRKEGDGQIPEGIYYVNHFNPVSNFHLSLGINYPNASDKILSDPIHPGGSIYIHGNCVTIGCIPITDDKIKELYILAVEAFNNGQQKIPVHLFPDRLTERSLNLLIEEYAPAESTIKLWKNLQSLYRDFQINHTLKPIRVDKNGGYSF